LCYREQNADPRLGAALGSGGLLRPPAAAAMSTAGAAAVAGKASGAQHAKGVASTIGTEGKQAFMEISARNQLTGTVQSVKSGAVMAEIEVSVDPSVITSAITDSSRERLGLKEGDQVLVIIKATEVMIAKP
jgi:molybdopterin-binding protein